LEADLSIRQPHRQRLSVSIINSGSAAMCIKIVSQDAANINVSDVSLDVTPCNQAPANISGKWKGK